MRQAKNRFPHTRHHCLADFQWGVDHQSKELVARQDEDGDVEHYQNNN